MKSQAAVLICLLVSASSPGRATARSEVEITRLYQQGMDSYAAGDHAKALDAFREVVRLDPGNRSARAAVRRIETETLRRGSETPVKESPPPEGRIDRLLHELRGLLRRAFQPAHRA